MELLAQHREFIAQHRHRPIAELALDLANRKHPDAAFILRQIEGWQRLRDKVPSWAVHDELLYPVRLSLEQCSGEPAAQYKAAVARRLFADEPSDRPLRMADLTGGFGVDFVALAPLFAEAFYVEQRDELVTLARHNFPILGVGHAQCRAGDGVAALADLPDLDLLFLDPARRDAVGRKTVLIEDCEPNVAELLPQLLEHSRVVMLKLSTMLDLNQAIDRLGVVAEAHVFAADGECKDLLLVCRRGHAAPPVFYAASERGAHAFTRAEEQTAHCPLAADCAGYLYEPDAALMKIGMFRSIAARWGLSKLHPNTHLYIGATLLPDFPGRAMRIVDVVGFSKRDQRRLSALGQANITVRNFPNTVAELRRRLKLRVGGDAYLFACLLSNGDKVVVWCERP